VQLLYEFFIKGGIMMWPLLACSILSLTFILERVFFWMQQREDEEALLDLARRGEAPPEVKGPVSLLVHTALAKRGRTREEQREALEVAASTALQEAERFTPILRTIGEVAPLLGFLGTVTGMIRAFHAIAIAGLGRPEVVASGISEALITTATGLFIAVPTYVAYNAFLAKADSLAGQLERVAAHLMEILADHPQEAMEGATP